MTRTTRLVTENGGCSLSIDGGPLITTETTWAITSDFRETPWGMVNFGRATLIRSRTVLAEDSYGSAEKRG